MIAPIYIADWRVWCPEGGHVGRVEVASFDPIPAESRPGNNPGLFVTVDGGDRPAAWVKCPVGSKLVGPAGSRTLCFYGEASSARAAWVILGMARHGRAPYSFAPEPGRAPAARIVEVHRAGEDYTLAPSPGSEVYRVVLPDGWSVDADGWIVQPDCVVPMCPGMADRNAAAGRFGLRLAAGSPTPPATVQSPPPAPTTADRRGQLAFAWS